MDRRWLVTSLTHAYFFFRSLVLLRHPSKCHKINLRIFPNILFSLHSLHSTTRHDVYIKLWIFFILKGAEKKICEIVENVKKKVERRRHKSKIVQTPRGCSTFSSQMSPWIKASKLFSKAYGARWRERKKKVKNIYDVDFSHYSPTINHFKLSENRKKNSVKLLINPLKRFTCFHLSSLPPHEKLAIWEKIQIFLPPQSSSLTASWYVCMKPSKWNLVGRAKTD